MSLESRLIALVQAIGADIKALQAQGGGGGSSAAIKQVEIDFGELARSTAVFSIVDSAVTATKNIIAVQSGEAATGRSADENEMDAISFRVVPANGSITLYATTLEGPVAGLYRVDYFIG